MIEISLSKQCRLLGTIALILLQSTNAIINETFNGYVFTIPDSPDNNLMTQSSANRWCQSNKNSLLEIYDSLIQGIVTHFINGKNEPSIGLNLGVRNIFTNGMRIQASPWIWVNGQGYEAHVGTYIQNQYNSFYTYGYLGPRQFGISFIADSQPSKQRGYICEGEVATTCNGGFKYRNRCYTSTTETLSWFGARNRCLTGGGDLASFDFVTDYRSFSSLNVSWINLSFSYWIGLRRQWWSWQGSGSEIKYTNWNNQQPQPSSSNCLCLMSPQWDWSECDCNQTYQFICARPVNDGSISTSSVPSNGPSRATSLSPSPTPTSYSTFGHDTYSSIDPTVPYSCDSNLRVGLGVGLGIGIPALVAVIILAGLLIREKRSRKYENSAVAKSESEATKPVPTYDSLQNRTAQPQDAYSSLTHIGNSDSRNSES